MSNPNNPFPPHIINLAMADMAGDQSVWPLLSDALKEINLPLTGDHFNTVNHGCGCLVTNALISGKVSTSISDLLYSEMNNYIQSRK